MTTRPEMVSTASTQSLHDDPPSMPPSAPGSPLGFHIQSLPGSRPVSPSLEGMATPGSSRPPSPLLRAMNNLSMSRKGDDEAAGEEGSVDGGDGKSKERRPSVGESLSRKNSLKAPLPRRGSSPALAPFLAKYDEYTGDDGKKQKVCVIGSGSWGTALARLAAQNAAEREG
jgi:hypothetical protein